MRFCTACMIAAGLPAANSKLALLGQKSPRTTFCDGSAHNRPITVDEFGTEVGTKTGAGAIVAPISLIRAGHSLMS
jgi:hypothetical protein